MTYKICTYKNLGENELKIPPVLPHNGIFFGSICESEQILTYITSQIISHFQARKKAGHEFINSIKLGNEPQHKNGDIAMNKFIKLAKILYFMVIIQWNITKLVNFWCRDFVIGWNLNTRARCLFELKKATKSTYREESGTTKRGP